MKRTSNLALVKRGNLIQSPTDRLRLLLLLGVAVVGCALAVTFRIGWHGERRPEPRYLADSVQLSPPPPLPPPDESAAMDQIRSLAPLRTAMQANGRSASHAAQFARASAAAGDLLEARGAYRSAIRLAPRPEADLAAGLGDAEQRLGQCREAMAAYTQLVDRFPLDYRGYLGQSQVQELLGHRRDAVNALDSARTGLPQDDIAGRLKVAEHFEAFGDLARALAEAEVIRARAPDSAEAILLTTHLYIKAERPDRALPLLNALLVQEPSNARARYQLGVVLDSPLLPNRSSLLAEDALLTAVESSPSETPAYRRLTEMYEQQRRVRQCAYAALQLLALTPDSAEARLHLSYAYGHLGAGRDSAEQGRIAAALLQRDRELTRLNTEIRQRPSDADARLAAGRHSLRYGRLLAALEAFQAAYAVAPRNTSARRELRAISERLRLPLPTGVLTE